MNTSLISRFFAAVAACLGLAQAAVAHDSIAAETASVWIFSDRYISTEHEFSEIAAQTDSVWIFSDRYISAEHEFSDLTSMIGSNTASTISITMTSIVNIRMGSSKDVKNSRAEFKKKCKEVVAVNRVPFRDATKLHNGPTQPGRRMSTTSCRRSSKSAVHNKLLCYPRGSKHRAARPALAQVGAFSGFTGHKRLHMRTEQPRAACSLMHSRQLAGHDKPQEKGK